MNDNDLVTIAIDDEVCIGVGQCELLEPDVFRIDDDTGIAELVGDGRLPRDRAQVAIDRCPSRALSIAD
ncbi:MAG: ferredoxin [Actinobacteria bacterium]|nr:ferredoxin [Actinomycetota bacterium]